MNFLKIQREMLFSIFNGFIISGICLSGSQAGIYTTIILLFVFSYLNEGLLDTSQTVLSIEIFFSYSLLESHDNNKNSISPCKKYFIFFIRLSLLTFILKSDY